MQNNDKVLDDAAQRYEKEYNRDAIYGGGNRYKSFVRYY
jgi:hypothetical protein